MDKLKELRERRESLIAKMQALLDLAASETRDLTPEEDVEYKAHEIEIEKIKGDIARREKLATLEQEARATSAPAYIPNFRGRGANGETPREWRGFGEFIYSLRFNRHDPRLQDVEYIQFETRDQSMGVGSEGGYMVPNQFRDQLLAVTPQEAIFRPRCTIIPAGDPPDATITMPALDQGAGSNMYGGVTVYPIGEGDTLTETQAKLREVSWTPHQFGAYVLVTNKLLANWQSAGAFIQEQLRKAKNAYEDTQFYKGNGVAKPKGVLNQAAAITVVRGTASTIVSGDIDNIMTRVKMGGSFLWIASQTTYPQLITLKNSNNWNLFATDYTKPMPNTLMGIPLVFADRSVALGTTGDLILVDLNYYLIKDGSGPYVDVSEHVYFTSAKTVVRLIWATDGNSWLNEALPLEGSTSNTVSPFVILGAA